MGLLLSRLKCPSCLQKYYTPKLLPCLHSICQNCLEKCLQNSTVSEDKGFQFQCPVCMKIVTKLPFDLPVEKWAAHFPVNAILLSLLTKTKMKVDKLCDPCLYGGSSIAAKSYCATCKEALCEACDSAHRKSRATREHTFLALDEIGDTAVAVTLAASMTCTYHWNKDVEFYCISHNSMCCSDCLDCHRGCNEILKLKEHVDELFKAVEPRLIKERMEELEKHLDKCTAVNDQTLQELETSTEDMTIEIDKLIDTLNEAKSRISKERRGLLKCEAQKSRSENHQCESLKATLRDSQHLLNAVVKNGDKHQILVILHKIKEQLAHCEKTINDKQYGVRQVKAKLLLNEHFISLRKLTDTQVAEIEVTENKQKISPCIIQNCTGSLNSIRTTQDEGISTGSVSRALDPYVDENEVDKSSDFDGQMIRGSDFLSTDFEINEESKDLESKSLKTKENKRVTVITSEDPAVAEEIESKPQDYETPRMIRVSGLARSVSKDALEMFFENKNRCCGGVIESLEWGRKKGEAFITFKDPSVVQSVLKKQEKESFFLEKMKLTVEEYVPPLLDPLRLFLTNVSPSVTEECLFLYLEPRCGATPTEILFGRLPGTALVTFSDPPDVGLLLRRIMEKTLQGQYIQVIRVPVTCCIQLRGLLLSTTTDTVMLYFENKKCSGGGPVKEIKFGREKQSLLITFKYADDAERVCMRPHVIDRKEVQVCLYHECLDDDMDADDFSDLTHGTEDTVGN